MTLDEVKKRMTSMEMFLTKSLDHNEKAQELCSPTRTEKQVLGRLRVLLFEQHYWLQKLGAHVSDWLGNCEVMESHFARLDAVIDFALNSEVDDETEA